MSVSRWMAVAAVAAMASMVSEASAGSVSAEYARQVDTAQLRMAQIEASQVEMEAALRRLEELQRSVVSQQGSGGEGADAGAVRDLRGEIEVLQFEMRTMKESIEALALDTDTRLLWLEQRTTAVERALGLQTPPMPVPGAPLGPELPTAGTGDDPGATDQPSQELDAEGLMELAVEHMTEGRQGAARAVLERLLREYPDDARVPEATYRVAETWFNDQRWSQAVTEFQKVIDRHPRHELASWAMLRQGEAFERQGARSDAVLFWEGVVSRYPGTPAADEAAELLQ